MKFYGCKARFACSADWVQVKSLGDFWDIVTDVIGYDDIVGLGMEWTGNEFTYALGSFDKDVAIRIPERSLREKGFVVEYLEIDLPSEDEWQTFTGRSDDLRKIYEEQIDDQNRKYDYELEFFNENGDAKIMIHYVDLAENTYKLFLKKVPENGKFQRVHAILLTKDGRVLLRYKNGEPRITGGRIDAGEQDLEETLKREISEELNCEIDRCDYLGYIVAKEGGDDGDEYWARMVARASKILPPKPDPDREGNWVYGRVLAPREIAYEEMTKVKIFGENNGKLLDAAYKVAHEKEYFTELPSDEYEVLNVETRQVLVDS